MEKALAFAKTCSLTEGNDVLHKVWLRNFRKKNNTLFAVDAPCTENDRATQIEQHCNNSKRTIEDTN
jgi:hypothetical protein